ncbi:MAG: sugar ABC transporter permease [Oscillospiraceae bacterium]|jgi:multiple sugar transport system permease protein|nr:sugar ABC transporter permease [Oscillospiraceae bacterium]
MLNRKKDPAVALRRPVLKRLWGDRASYFFMLPYLSIFVVFTMLPVLVSFLLSFTYFNVLQMPRFVGFQNYIKLFTQDEIFLIAIKNTFYLALVTGPAGYLLSLTVAWLINELNPKLRAFTTLIFYAPSISGNVFMIWGVMFSGDSHGYLNGLLLNMGVIKTSIQFTNNPKYIMPLVMGVSLWLSLGAGFLSFIAGLQGIDRQYYEAAAIDGIRNRWQELWFVTLPLMKEQLMFGAVMSITGAFGIGGVVSALVGFPSTGYAAHTIMHHLEDYGGIRFEMGYASAIATFLFAIMMLSNHAVKKQLSKIGR